MAIVNGYLTLAQYKALYDIGDNLDNSVIERGIEAASRQIDNETGRCFVASGSLTKYFDAPYGTRALYVDDLLTVTGITNGDGVAIPVTEYYLYPKNYPCKNAIILKASSDYYWCADDEGNREGAIAITGTWGYSATPPAEIVQACAILAARLIKRRDSIFGVAGSNAVGEAVLIMKIDPDVEALIGPYRRQM